MNSGERLSSLLLTPRTDIAEKSRAIIREPLLGSQTLITEIASYNTTAKSYDDTVMAATSIAQIVRNTLNYDEFYPQTDLLTPPTIADTEHADCYGQTTVLSECLDEAGIDHFICFANGHVFVLLGDKEEHRYSMVDPLIGKYNGEITEAIAGRDIFEQFASGQKSANVILNTLAMLRIRGLAAKTLTLNTVNKWISHSRTLTDQPTKSHILHMKIFPPEIGRKMIVRYANAIISINKEDSDAATAEINELDSMYPDVDPRNRLRIARQARTLAFKQKKWGNALLIASYIERNAEEIGLMYARYFMPDTLRKIGNLTGIGELMEHAIEKYAEVPHQSNVSKGKLRRTHEQRDALSLRQSSEARY